MNGCKWVKNLASLITVRRFDIVIWLPSKSVSGPGRRVRWAQSDGNLLKKKGRTDYLALNLAVNTV